MRRREKFILSSVLLGLGLLGLQYVPLEYRLPTFAVFFVFSYLVSVWALYDDLYGVEWVTIIPFPAMYGTAVGLFYFLLPQNLASRFFIIGLFAVGMYALYLTSNIYSVAKTRTIQLLRAAHTIGLFFTLLTSMLAMNFLFSLHLHLWWNGLVAGAIHFPLILMSLWSVELQPRINRRIMSASIIYAILIAQFVMAISFLPFSVLSSSILTIFLVYVVLGILHNHIQERLFRNTLIEYILFSVLAGVYFFLNLQWK